MSGDAKSPHEERRRKERKEKERKEGDRSSQQNGHLLLPLNVHCIVHNTSR
jgi:hypothetical protein